MEQQIKQWALPGRIVAAPSWVFPGTVAENCHTLAPLVDEVGIVFFETASSLATPQHDIALGLALLPLRFHVHLPVDLPFQDPPKAVAIVLQLLDKVVHLGLERAVIHPPAGPNAATLAARFLDLFALGGGKIDFLWENTKENSLVDIEPFIIEQNQAICLDIGHFLAYEQDKLGGCLPLLQRVAMVHVNAPGQGEKKSRHLPLTVLSKAEQAKACALFGAVPASAVVMLELFTLSDIACSLPIVREWLAAHTVPGTE